ncbi:2-phospho-L-lactate guanylyltransferase [Humibacillus xanthopallidus]|uniref:2-phospho-L-lactate guanylyltransferase n=1 Tax=Humibacillus xanthopallidus TaxID=412689 RepID=UPI00384E88F4
MSHFPREPASGHPSGASQPAATPSAPSAPGMPRQQERSPAPFLGSDHPWHVVIPVKQTAEGKSRLGPAVGEDRALLSRAIADDTIAAAVATVGPGRVVVVTSDRGVRTTWRASGVVVVEDPGSGLNAALRAGQSSTPRGRLTAALLGDVPAMRPQDLAEALGAALLKGDSFVPDAAGDGTVLRCGAGFEPRFGPHSAARHESDGAARLELDLPRLRTDVDDATSLAAAHRLGLGPRTRALLGDRASGWIRAMQASVHTFDPETRTGSVLRDDGVQLSFDAHAFDASGLRLLRSGQRLTVEVVDDLVVSMRIVGIGHDQRIR